MRWIVRALSLFGMLVVVLVGLVLLIPSEKVGQIAARELTKATGRTLTLTGSMRPTLWPVLGVKTGAVSIANAGWSDAGPLLLAEGLAIGLDMSALIGGTVRITNVDLLRPQFTLERAADGRGNWDYELQAGANSGAGISAATTATQPFSLDKATIRGGTLRFIDHGANSRVTLADIDADLALPDFTGPATLSATATKDDKPLTINATIGAFDSFLQGRVVPVDLAATLGKSTVDFAGRVGSAPLTAEGKLTADLVDLAPLMALVGQPVPDLPEGLGRRVRQVSGTLTLAPEGTLHLRGGSVVLDGNRLSGDADLTFAAARPKISAQITAGALDLSGAVGAGSPGGTNAPAGPGWSRAPLDVSALSGLDATLALAADSLDLGNARLGRTRLLVTLDRARAVVDAREIAAYGGSITGQFVVNGRSGLSIGGDLVFSGLVMQPLLKDVAGFDRLLGTGDFALKFLGVGNSMAALMNSLSGSGRLSFGKGELRGLDLVGMLRTLDAGYVGEGAKTIFDAVTGSFTLKDGVLTNEDLALAAPYISATGKGTVGIGARDLNYRIVPTALVKEDGSGGVRVPLLITGPWAKPRYQLDLKALADEKLKAQADQLKERAKQAEADAKAKLATKAQKELGVTQQDGENLQEAAKRRAQEALADEAAKALRKMLGGN